MVNTDDFFENIHKICLNIELLHFIYQGDNSIGNTSIIKSLHDDLKMAVNR